VPEDHSVVVVNSDFFLSVIEYGRGMLLGSSSICSRNEAEMVR